MKKLLYILFTVCLFTACSSDDGDDNDNNNNNQNKEFKWNGDWNDPNDPNYVEGGYNPIVGLWEDTSDSEIRFKFSIDFKETRYIWDKKTSKYVPNESEIYIINNTAFRTDRYIYARYKFVDGKLLLNQLSNSGKIMDDKWYEYKKVKE